MAGGRTAGSKAGSVAMAMRWLALLDANHVQFFIKASAATQELTSDERQQVRLALRGLPGRRGES